MSPPSPPLPAADLEHILAHTAALWRELAGSRIFITGGTGFFGKWVLESIAAANDHLGAKVRATILTRNLANFSAEVPHLAARAEFDWLIGDTASFAFPSGHFDYIFHFATASAAKVGAGDTASMMTTLLGTERVLQFASACGARRMLFSSSGAVYGRQPPELSHIPEDYRGGPDLTNPASAYGEMKRLCEIMCLSAVGVECVIARGFSFIGPYLPLTDKFAIGSFIRYALAGGPIRIRGDGTPVRSYLYGADLAIWLITLLLRGRLSTAYNVGSDTPTNLRELAECVAACAPTIVSTVTENNPTVGIGGRYVPSIRRAQSELGLEVGFDLAAAIARSMGWATAAR